MASEAAVFWEERDRIEREVRHAEGTRWPEGDSWIKGYAQDIRVLLREIDALVGDFSTVCDEHASDEIKMEARRRFIEQHGRPSRPKANRA